MVDMIVAVGSTNPTKIKPVKDVFSYYFGDVEITGVSVPSGVAEQPLGDDEMYKGALTRARGALHAVPGAQFGVGIEGGVRKAGYGWFESSLVVVMDREGKTGVGSSGGLVLPERVMEKIRKGKTLEQAIDELFGTNNIGEGMGMFGVLTKGLVTRTEGVKHGVAFALARFLHDWLY